MQYYIMWSFKSCFWSCFAETRKKSLISCQTKRFYGW